MSNSNRLRKLAALTVVSFALAGTSAWADDSPPSEKQLQPAAVEPSSPSAGDQPVLRTQEFENGSLHLRDIDCPRLETFLQDLNRRRDYDYSQHEHRPGPDNAYLTHWVDVVMNELLDRGYYLDRHGELHRPGAVVPTR